MSKCSHAYTERGNACSQCSAELEQDRNEWKCSQQAYKAEAEELRAEVERLRELVTDLWVLDTDSLVEALEEAGND